MDIKLNPVLFHKNKVQDTCHGIPMAGAPGKSTGFGGHCFAECQ
jgi:hypothetical protein